MNIYLSSAYLAPIQYYSIILNENNKIYIDQYENYVKQSYRNRCTIMTANGPLVLSVPIESNAGKKCIMKDICIAEHGNWRHLHWNAIVSAYNSSPFFEYFEDDFRPFYDKKYKFLFDFNEELRYIILNLLEVVNIKVDYTSEYALMESSDNCIDLRQQISPKKDWRQYDSRFTSVPYYQVFDERYGFVENLSIIDLLFNMGNESLIILKQTIKKAF